MSDVGSRVAVNRTFAPCTAGFQEQVAVVVAILEAQPPMTFPLA